MKKIFLNAIRIKDFLCRRLRVFYYSMLLNESGERVIIDKNVDFIYPQKISLGSRVTINRFSLIQGTPYSNVIIGDNVVISYNVKILTASLKLNIFPFEHYYADVVIGNKVWLAANVTILPGVLIPDNVIVAANSVVTKNLESGYVYGGIPAKKIKKIEYDTIFN